MKRVILEVGQLVLRGVAPAEANAVMRAVRAELGRRLAEPGAADALSRVGHRAELSLAPIQIGSGANSRALGTAVGSSVAGGLAKVPPILNTQRPTAPRPAR
jgi:hypothetical protein